jgi:hypothetical protein
MALWSNATEPPQDLNSAVTKEWMQSWASHQSNNVKLLQTIAADAAARAQQLYLSPHSDTWKEQVHYCNGALA